MERFEVIREPLLGSIARRNFESRRLFHRRRSESSLTNPRLTRATIRFETRTYLEHLAQTSRLVARELGTREAIKQFTVNPRSSSGMIVIVRL